MTRGRKAARKTCLRRARLPGYHPPRHAARPRKLGDAHDADLTTPDPLPRRRRRAPACRPRRGFRAGSRRSGAQDHPLFRHARGGAAIVPGRAADRPGVAPARARRRGAPDGAPAAEPGRLVRARAWDATMWRMVGRPERSDPDELVFNLFHSSTAPRGFNFVGYKSPEYDRIAEQQRQAVDIEARKKLIREAQAIVSRDAPYAFLIHPKTLQAFNQQIWDAGSIVIQKGVGIRNFWTFVGAAPKGAQRTMIINSGTQLQAIHPLYIAGAPDSWVNELVWDRLVRVGPDGLPRPWAAESFTFVNDRTVDVTIRDGMTFHDGRPVTVNDVIFSFEAPMRTDKVPMFKPVVSDIEAIERTGERGLLFNLKQINSAFATTALGRVFIAPKHVWEPHLKSVEGKPENIESIRDSANVGSGPFRQVRARLNEEIVLERFDKHWAAPKMDRLVVRIIPNAEAVIGMLRSGELNLLAEYGGDPEVLEALAKEVRRSR